MSTTARRVVVVAPTGIAALNVDGYTIHRLFGFNATTDLDAVTDGRYRPGRFAKTLASLETLIIDEASMVRADLFDMLVAALERFGPTPGTPFGGVQLVLVGDLFQLPPVVHTNEAEFFTTRYATPYFFSADRFSRADFPTVALTTVFRQLGDQRLTALLNAVREGVLIEQAQAELNARTDPDFIPPDDELWLTLAPTNRVVGARNRQHLERLPGPVLTHRAEESGDLSMFDPPVDPALELKVGAQVMMLNNDSADRWVNGTLGRITDIGREPRGVVVTVELRDGTGADVRPYTWEATRPVVEGGVLRREVVGTYTQLPFKLAWAITIHKSQGQTLDRLVVDLRGGAFDFGQVYVALSRCTSMDGLVLTRPVLPKDLKTDRRIVRFLRESTSPEQATRLCAISILTVGDEGRLSRPRPVEIAVAFDDGSALSTLVNPHRDLADAKSAFGISVEDVLLAPSLAEAWSVLGPLLDGCTPVGVGIDETLALIDFELKRLGTVTPLPIGIEVARAALTAEETGDLLAPAALVRARAVMRAYHRAGAGTTSGTAFDPATSEDARTTYLLTRDSSAEPPTSAVLPTLSALVDVSRVLSGVLLGGTDPSWVSPPELAADLAMAAAVRQVVSERLASAAGRSAGLPPVLLDRLRRLEQLLEIDVVEAVLTSAAAGRPAIGDVLHPGARICFTGTVQLPGGSVMERDAMNSAAAERGLVPVGSVSKTRCDVLVVAELGTQSGKARKAKELGKPVFSADEFLAWLAAP